MSQTTCEAYGIFIRRRDGDVPKLSKMMDNKIHSNLSDATIAAAMLELELETEMDVRKLLVTVLESIDPSRHTDVDTA